MSVTPEDLMAYADGALEGADRARVEAAIAADPSLQAQVEKHRALSGLLTAAYAPVLEEAVPTRLTQAAREAPTADNVASIESARSRRPPSPWRLREWGAMAAALLLGVIIGGQTLRPADTIVASYDGLEARGALARALETQLAADDGPVRIGISFRSKSGDACRTFSASSGALNGLACKNGPNWRIDIAMRGAALAATEFRTAGVETPPEVLARVDEMIVGDPLDATGERRARSQNWRALK